MQVYNRPDLSAVLVRGIYLMLVILVVLCGAGIGWREYGWLRPAPRLADVPIYPHVRNLVRLGDQITFETDDSNTMVFDFYTPWATHAGWQFAQPRPLIGVPINEVNYFQYFWPSAIVQEYGLEIETNYPVSDFGEELGPVTVTIKMDQLSFDGLPPTWPPDPNKPTPVPQPALPTPIPTAAHGR